MIPTPYAPVLVLLALAALLGAACIARDARRYQRAGRDWRPGRGRGTGQDGGGL